MAIEVFNRYEHKYLLNTAEFGAIRKTVEQHMDSDPYNIGGKPYTIANIYYDTADDYLIRNSLGKPMYKEKLRLRAYGRNNGEPERRQRQHNHQLCSAREILGSLYHLAEHRNRQKLYTRNR